MNSWSFSRNRWDHFLFGYFNPFINNIAHPANRVFGCPIDRFSLLVLHSWKLCCLHGPPFHKKAKKRMRGSCEERSDHRARGKSPRYDTILDIKKWLNLFLPAQTITDSTRQTIRFTLRQMVLKGWINVRGMPGDCASDAFHVRSLMVINGSLRLVNEFSFAFLPFQECFQVW